jgi:glutaredoxin-related protein
MKSFYLIILFPFLIISTKKSSENKTSYIPNNQIYDVNDLTIDFLIKDGTKYRWLILFYLSTCEHCAEAKEKLLKIYQNYNNTNTRFAQIEIHNNIITNFRFNITGVPYIILVENKKIFEFQEYPNEKNLIKFLNTSFDDVKDEIFDFPKQVNLFYVIWTYISQYIEVFAQFLSVFFYYYTGIEYNFQVWHVIFIGIMILVIFCTLEYWLLGFCCNDEEEINKNKVENKDNNVEKKEEKKNDNINNNDNKSEEKKIEEEIQKENEKLEKEKKIESNNMNDNSGEKKIKKD